MTDCCEGRRPAAKLDRRCFIRRLGLGALSMAVLPSFAHADSKEARRRKSDTILVPIFLRGGADGLNMIVPYSDASYARLRRDIALAAPKARGVDARERCLDLDGRFGLHPAMRELAGWWKSGEMAVVHGVGRKTNTYSHFAEQDAWEVATEARRRDTDGWLNRYLAGHKGRGPVRAVSFGGSLPRMLRGDVPVQAVRELGDLRIERPTRDALAEAYGGGEFSRAGKGALAAIDVLGKLDPGKYKPAHGATYPDHELGWHLRHAAQLIKADIGVEVVEVELGGWDTHAYQGSFEGGHAELARQLTTGLHAFLTDLGKLRSKVCVMCFSEFGRTAKMNGNGGTDHGHGNLALVFGGGVKGGKHHGKWTGLATDKLHQKRDLAAPVDFRDLFGEVMLEHLGAPDLAAILPRWKRTRLELF